jgi:hypothetical protein
MDELKLPPMVITNEDPKGTAFSVTVDAVKEKGESLIDLREVPVADSNPLKQELQPVLVPEIVL